MVKFEHRDNFIRLGLKIAYYRKLKGMTQEQLAEKVGVNTSYIGQIEAPNMAQSFALELLFDIANALDVLPYKLMKFDED